MSWNGCRKLCEGCDEDCILRQSLQAMQSPQAQANATVFEAKCFGRVRLTSFFSSVKESQRPGILGEDSERSLGITADGELVETVLRGGVPRTLPEFQEGFDDIYGRDND